MHAERGEWSEVSLQQKLEWRGQKRQSWGKAWEGGCSGILSWDSRNVDENYGFSLENKEDVVLLRGPTFLRTHVFGPTEMWSLERNYLSVLISYSFCHYYYICYHLVPCTCQRLPPARAFHLLSWQLFPSRRSQGYILHFLPISSCFL